MTWMFNHGVKYYVQEGVWAVSNSVTSSGNVKQEALKNVGPIRHCEPPHAHSPDVASSTVARRLRIDVHDIDNDNA